MAGNKAGGVAASLTNKEKYGENYYKIIGQLGGRKSRNGGFAANRELAKRAGQIGGSISRRNKSK